MFMINGIAYLYILARSNLVAGAILLMTGINFILLNKQKNAILFSVYFLGLVSFNCFAQPPVVACPSSFSDGHGVHKLIDVMVYDGPVCMDVSLVPEYKKIKKYGI